MVFSWFKRKAPKSEAQAASPLQQGNKLLAAGQLEAALSCYQQAVAEDENNAAAYVNLGYVLAELGRKTEARHCLQQALKIDAQQADAQFMLGVVLESQGETAAAIAHLQEAIESKPDFGTAYERLCILYLLEEKREEAKQLALRGLAMNQDLAELHYCLGYLQSEEGDYHAAVTSYQRLLALSPDHLTGQINLGICWTRLKQHEKALACFARALELKPDFSQAYVYQGNAQREMQRLKEALQSYDRAIAKQPDLAEAYLERGMTYRLLEKPIEALHDFDLAIELDAKFAKAHLMRGMQLQDNRQYEQALASYRQAMAIEPNLGEAHNNQGNVLRQMKRFVEALQCYDQAVALLPQSATAHCNRAILLTEMQRLVEAEESFDQALRLEPDCSRTRLHRAFLLLITGNYAEGFAEYEWRWQKDATMMSMRCYPQPYWLGKQNLAGKTILLFAEQGFGDAIQFCRYVQNVVNLGAKVILEVHAGMRELMAQIDAASQIVSVGDPQPQFDYYTSLLSLPLALGLGLSDISGEPYLRADEDKLALWQKRLGKTDRPRIGLVWSGNPKHENDHNRSLSLVQLRQLLPDGLDYFCLQKEIREADYAVLSAATPIKNFTQELQNFTDTAALISLMDIVITVDTSVAHLAGALGKEVWILLPYAPDWRWLLDRDDSPWYDSARLFRQQEIGEWQAPLQAVADRLTQRFAKL